MKLWPLGAACFVIGCLLAVWWSVAHAEALTRAKPNRLVQSRMPLAEAHEQDEKGEPAT